MYERDERTGLVLAKGTRLPAKVWRCKKGHTRQADIPFRLEYRIGDEVVMKTRPLCPVCLRTWMERQFGVHEFAPATVTQRRRTLLTGGPGHADVSADPAGT
jgi:hypothetical protein